MKYLALAILTSLSCAGSRPGMPERVGGLLGAKVEDGPCLETGAILFFFKDSTHKQYKGVPLEKGCRCSYKINGVEYMPTNVFPPIMCEEYKAKQLREESEKNEQGTGASTPIQPQSYGL